MISCFLFRRPRRGIIFAIALCALYTGIGAQATDVPPSQVIEQKPDINYRYPVGGKLARDPIVQGDTVYLLSQDRAVYALNDIGKILFRWQAPNKTGTLYPALYGLVFFLPGDDSVIALNRVGREAFRLYGLTGLRLPPVLSASGRIYAATRSLTCYGLSGVKKWSLSLPSSAVAGPVCDESETVSVLCADGTLVIASAKGAVIAEIKAGGADALAVSSGLVAVASGNKIALYSSVDGSPSGSFTLPAKALNIEAQKDGIDFAVLTADSSVHGISAQSGITWTVPVRREAPLAIVCRDNRVYALSRGLVTAIDVKGGVWRELAIRNADTMPSVSERGMVYSGGLDWILYSYRFEELPKPPLKVPASFAANPPLPALLGLDPRIDTDDGQKELLSEVEKILKSGTIGEGEDEAFALCSYVLKTVQDTVRPSGKPLSQYDPMVRIKAADILTGLGGMEMRAVLLDAFTHDPDSAVKASCATNLGVLGFDGDGKVSEAFMNLLVVNATRPDERLADAITRAIEAIYRFEGAPANPAAVRALIKVSEGPYSEPVRKRALETMLRISRGTY